MTRTTDISGFQDILDGAVAIDPNAAAREIGVIRDLIAGTGLEGQLDGMLHNAMLKHVATGAPPAEQGDLIRAPASEASTTEGGAGEDEILAQPQAVPSRQTPAAASFQGLEDDPRSAHGRVTDPVGLSEAKDRVRQALPKDPPTPPLPAMQPPAELDQVSVRDPHSDARYIKDGDGALVRDLDGAPIEIDPQPGDPALTPADVETMSQRLDMLDELQAQKDMTPQAFERRLEILRETVGDGGALGLAFEAVAAQGRARLRGEDDPSHDLAVAKAHALARDPSVHAAMRENREALERLTPEERSAAKAKRYGVESDMRDLMKDAHALSSDDPNYDRKIAEFEARYVALLVRDAGIPGVPHLDVDPGLAHDLGHTAGDLLEGRAAVQDIMITAGLAVTPP